MTMASSSSSSPTKKKSSTFSPIQQTLFKKPNSFSSKATSLIKRQDTVFRKAEELSILCGIEVCVICYGPDGELKTWPEDREKVKDIARRYSELTEKQRRRGSVNLCDFLEKINKEDSKKKNKKMKTVKLVSNNKYPDWDPRFEDYSQEQLLELVQSLERNQTRLQHRIRAVGEARKQNTDMDDQEHRMSTMNHHPLQQNSNQVSMFLFNHGNGNLTQIPVSSSAFNHSQSLPPFPTPLTIYPNPNEGNYSGLLGAQEIGINGFHNMNMLTYNTNTDNCFPIQIRDGEDHSGLLAVQETGINKFQNTNTNGCNNINVEDYDLGLLGVQDYGMTNELQNINMCGYDDNNNNNTNTNNDLSQQLVQFPTKTTEPGFQFGPSRTQY